MDVCICVLYIFKHMYIYECVVQFTAISFEITTLATASTSLLNYCQCIRDRKRVDCPNDAFTHTHTCIYMQIHTLKYMLAYVCHTKNSCEFRAYAPTICESSRTA